MYSASLATVNLRLPSQEWDLDHVELAALGNWVSHVDDKSKAVRLAAASMGVRYSDARLTTCAKAKFKCLFAARAAASNVSVACSCES